MAKEFFDNAIDKAKDIIGVAYKKTDEVISVEKLKFTLSSLKSKINKDYQKIGEFYYNSLKQTDVIPDEIAATVKDIDDKLFLSETIKSEINQIKDRRICPSCGASIDKDATFCPKCGAQLYFDTKE